MSQLSKYQCQMSNAIKEQQKKTIKKIKKKNQYTVDFQFTKVQEELLQKIFLINSLLPMELSQHNPFRLKSDLQLAQQRSNEQLGELFVDIFSANYGVCSVQNRGSLILLNLEPYHLEEINFVEVEKYYQNINPQYCEILSKFQCVQEQSLSPSFIASQIHSFSELEQLELYTKNYPLSGYISRVKDGRRYTVSKFINMPMLSYMGITQSMLEDYVCETKNIPYDIYCGENYYDQIGEIYKLPSKFKDDPSCIEHQNYSGQRLYPKKASFQKLVLLEESQNSYIEYYFYKIEDFDKDINLEQIKINELNYFNLKKHQDKDDKQQNVLFGKKIVQEVQLSKQPIQNRCGIRKINRNTE